ncbi:MAG: secretin and TonB N-terminal domain-containing protein [Candidatus Rokubacteria bacterium]|nr:secretin and TonB N-terminal domain-containing protein [Candidatus Rokubacteria bacterium]
MNGIVTLLTPLIGLLAVTALGGAQSSAAENPAGARAEAMAGPSDTRMGQVAPAPVRLAQAQPPVPRPPSSAGRLLSLDFKDADIVNLLRILAAESGRNIVAGDDVRGRVSISLRNVTWEQALDAILEVRGLEKIEKGGVIRVVSAEQLARERDLLIKAEEARRKAEIEVRTKQIEAQLKEADLQAKRAAAEAAAAEAQARGPLTEETIRILYADPEEIARTLQGILGIPAEGMTPAALPPAPYGVPPVIGDLNRPLNPDLGRVYGPGPPPVLSPTVGPIASPDTLAKGLTIRAYRPANSIFLRLYAADLARIKKLIRESLDVPVPQVKIEARMEILDRNALEAIGVQWGGGVVTRGGSQTLVGQGLSGPRTDGIAPTGINPANPNLTLDQFLPVGAASAFPTGSNLVNLPIGLLPNFARLAEVASGGIAFGLVGTNFNINLALQALAAQGKARSLARPEISTVENARATVSLGEEIPFTTVSSAGTQVQFKEAVLKLEVTPTIIREQVDGQEVNKIKMLVVVENNERGNIILNGVPNIRKRRAETLVVIREGERLVISGVTQGRDEQTVRKVPFFGDIPVVGWLFKQRETFAHNTELVLFLTPAILPLAPSVATAR